MILYFSGTGNSAYVARQLGELLQEETIDVFARIRDKDTTALQSSRPWIVVCPTYAWRIPRILHQWLENTALEGCHSIYFVMTCGDNIGNAEKTLKTLCISKHMDFCGCYPIVMPENYIALFTTPTKEEALVLLRRAEGKIAKAADMIRLGKHFPEPTIPLAGSLEQRPCQRCILSDVCACKEILCQGIVYFLRTMCQAMSAAQYSYGKWQAGMGQGMHALHGLHLSLPGRGNRVWQTQPGPAAVCLPEISQPH